MKCIKLIPVDGPTLKKKTEQEFELGYNFRVVNSTSPKFRRGSVVTKQDLDNEWDYHGDAYQVSFEVLSVLQHTKQRAETDYAFSQWTKDNCLLDLIG